MLRIIPNDFFLKKICVGVITLLNTIAISTFSHINDAIHKAPFQTRRLPYVMVKEVPYTVEKEQKLGFCPQITGGRMEIFVQAETLLHGHVAPKGP